MTRQVNRAYKHELIGSTIEIVNSKNKTLIGLKGKIINETKNMLILQCPERKNVPKKDLIIKLGKKTLKGKSILGRPEDRIKK